MKIALLIDSWEAFTQKYVTNLLAEFSEHKVEIFSINQPPISTMYAVRVLEKSGYLYSTAQPTMYSEFLNYVEAEKFELIIATRIHFPEYFILALEVKNLDAIPITIAFYGVNEIVASPIRELTLRRFFLLNQGNKVIIHTNCWWDKSRIELSELIVFTEQIYLLSDPQYEQEGFYSSVTQPESRKKLGIPENKTVILFFGAMFFGKGLDILLNSAKILQSDFYFIIASSTKGLNYDLDFELLQQKNVRHIDQFIPEDLVQDLFSASTIICLPYRASYENGSSGVLVQAALAGKPICVPNIKPFSEVINQFQVGQTFEVENSADLVNVLGLDIWKQNYQVHWQEYLASMSTWENIASKYLS
jgi:glycosyltransferase involved in cell wall biosynthesis